MTDIFVKQLDGCTYYPGGNNCTCATHAMWLFRASGGKISTSSCAVRKMTNDRSGGTNLGQMEQISLQYGIDDGRVYRPASWTTLQSLLLSGRYGAHIQLHYSVIAPTRYDCFDNGFFGNHDVYCSGPGTQSGTLRIGDPGADGRRAGIPSGYQDIPIALIRYAAARLNVATTGYKPLGTGLVYTYVTPPDPSTASPHYRATVTTATKLWNDSTHKWVYSSSPIPVNTVLEVRSAQYTKGDTDCYPVTSGSCSKLYAGYYVPVKNVKLGNRC